jgi:hypothetical protein
MGGRERGRGENGDRGGLDGGSFARRSLYLSVSCPGSFLSGTSLRTVSLRYVKQSKSVLAQRPKHEFSFEHQRMGDLQSLLINCYVIEE